MTLEEYIKQEYGEGKIDFTFRASVYEDKVLIYIHPLGRDGVTTPNLRVKGNLVVTDAPASFIGEGDTR